MTGHGQSSTKSGPNTIDVEVRTVNNRYLKVSARAPDLSPLFENEIEGLVREVLRRGSVTVNVRVSGLAGAAGGSVSQGALKAYLQEAKKASVEYGVLFDVEWGSLLQLPGVLETKGSVDDPAILEAVRKGIRSALTDLQRMRMAEGQSMQARLLAYLAELESLVSRISSRAPLVLQDYKSRLEQKVRSAVESRGLELGDIDVTREIVLFSDKSDISEELTRLDSHLKQFHGLFSQTESQGRRIDFLLQEMGRETNTIGSKANDSEISSHVVTIKVIMEQIRELVQNVE
ncbi:MAG: YicC/YloC family endoribonuclease [Pirellula sp.]